MATSSSGSSSTLSGLRLSGTSLMSGLDTESIVKQMASATKNRINKQQQKLDVLGWKQNDYRSIIKKLQNFQNTYFNSTKPSTNLGSSTLLNAYKATSSNPNVKATGTSQSTAATYNITNVQLAKTAELTSSASLASVTDGIKVDFTAGSDPANASTTYTVQVTLDGNAKQIAFNGGADIQQNFLDALSASTAFGATEGAKFSVADGKLKYTNAAGDTVSHNYSILPTTNQLDSDATNNSVLKAAAMNAIGSPSGGSNRIATGMQLKDIGFTTALTGGGYSFTINGESFSFDSTATLGQVISKVNSSTKANVTLSFDTLSQKFSLKSDNSGASSELSVTQTGGNLLSAMFGSDVIGAGNSISSNMLISRGITGTAQSATDFMGIAGTNLKVTVNGETKEIGLWKYDNNGVLYDFKDTTDSKGNVTTGGSKAAAALNTELTKEFGSNAPTVTFDANTKQFTIKGASVGDVVSIDKIAGNADSATLLSGLGFTSGQTNAITGSTTVSSLYSGAEGAAIQIGSNPEYTITAATTLDDLKAAFGSDVEIDLTKGIINAKAQISSSNAAGQAMISSIFGGSYASINVASGSLPATAGTSGTVLGTNAVVTINGTSIANTTNIITINGTTIDLTNMTDADVASVNGGTPITIATVRDTSSIKDVIVKFIDEYNTLISDLNTAITTKRPTDDGTLSGTKFEPLTDEQREDMTDDEIEKWEEKAKTGLLYNDSAVFDVLTRLRTAANTRAGGISLMDLGITISTAYKDNGKLSINDEAALDANLSKYADQIKTLFTDPDRGLAANFTKALNSGVSTSRITGYGSLIRVAGAENTVSGTDNEISNRVTEYQTVIKSLKSRYTKELERYWAKFTALETMTAKYSNYSAMFTSATS